MDNVNAYEAYRRHKDLTERLFQQLNTETNSAAEMMLCVESLLVGTMLMLVEAHGYNDAGAKAKVNIAMEEASKRFKTIRIKDAE